MFVMLLPATEWRMNTTKKCVFKVKRNILSRKANMLHLQTLMKTLCLGLSVPNKTNMKTRCNCDIMHMYNGQVKCKLPKQKSISAIVDYRSVCIATGTLGVWMSAFVFSSTLNSMT